MSSLVGLHGKYGGFFSEINDVTISLNLKLTADEKKPPRQNIRIEGESNVSKNGGMWAGSYCTLKGTASGCLYICIFFWFLRFEMKKSQIFESS